MAKARPMASGQPLFVDLLITRRVMPFASLCSLADRPERWCRMSSRGSVAGEKYHLRHGQGVRMRDGDQRFPDVHQRGTPRRTAVKP